MLENAMKGTATLDLIFTNNDDELVSEVKVLENVRKVMLPQQTFEIINKILHIQVDILVLHENLLEILQKKRDLVIDCKVKYGTRIKGLLIKHFGNTGDSNKNENGRITNTYVLMTVHKRTNNIIRK